MGRNKAYRGIGDDLVDVLHEGMHTMELGCKIFGVVLVSTLEIEIVVVLGL